MRVLHAEVSDFYADVFLMLATAALALNFLSQPLAMPFQIALVLAAVFKCDIKLIPAVCVCLFDKRNFLAFETSLMKFQAGISLGVSNFFLIGMFFFVLLALFRNRWDRKSLAFVIPWFASLIPAAVIGLIARADGLTSSWQQVFVDFLAPSIYFWGCLVGRSWWRGREYFIKRMLLVSGVIVGLSLLKIFGMPTAFAINIVPLCLALATFRMKCSLGWRVVGVVAGICAVANMLFSRMIARNIKGEYTDSVDLGSTFTSMFVIVIGVGLAVSFGVFIKRGTIKVLLWIAVLVLAFVFAFSVSRASTTKQSEVASVNNVESWAERFEGKLIGDRGETWKNALENEVFIRPLVFKRLRKLYTTRFDPNSRQFVEMMLMPPHNQILTLLWRDGLWLGGTMVVFLFWVYGRSANAASAIFSDRVTLISLLCPFVSIFLAVGLTGQVVFSAGFYANAIASLFYPGVLYGAALNSRFDMEFLGVQRHRRM